MPRARRGKRLAAPPTCGAKAPGGGAKNVQERRTRDQERRDQRDARGGAVHRGVESEIKLGEALKVVSWNSCHLAQTTIAALVQSGADAVLLQELHGDHARVVADKGSLTAHRLYGSAPATPEDPAAGCAILLSQELNKAVVASGSCGPRIAWVRLKT